MAKEVLIVHERADVLASQLKNSGVDIKVCKSEADLKNLMNLDVASGADVVEARTLSRGKVRLVLMDERIFKGAEALETHAGVLARFKVAFPNAGLIYLTGSTDSFARKFASITAETGTPDFVYGVRTAESVTAFILDETVKSVAATDTHNAGRASLEPGIWTTL